MQIWKQRNGEEILVSNMEISHINAAINMLKIYITQQERVRMAFSTSNHNDRMDSLEQQAQDWIKQFKSEITKRKRQNK